MPPVLTFTRLTDVPLDAIAQHMSDPRVAAHMPLLTGPWDIEMAAAFVAAKDARWTQDGLGHWAIWADGDYVGWGGLQREGAEWDFGLVLRPDHFGLGLAIARKTLTVAAADPRIPYVTVLLPSSRKNLGALARFGADLVGVVLYEGTPFRKYRLATPSP